jgi:hypothetical protein
MAKGCTPSQTPSSGYFGAPANAFEDPIANPRLCNTTVEACLNGDAKGLKLGLIFPFIRFKCAQTGAEDFAGIGVLAALDLGVHELIHLWSEVDVSGGHFQ